MENLPLTSLVHDSQKPQLSLITLLINANIFYLFSNEVCIFCVSCSITAENLGFTTYPPAYLSKRAKGKNLLGGANFASAASGYYEPTAELYVKTRKTEHLLNDS
jgi:hypothetical protein